MAAGRINVLNSIPPHMKALRTRVGLPPRAMRRSYAHPLAVDDRAIPQNGTDPNTAIMFAEKCRSITRYDGSQNTRKYHA